MASKEMIERALAPHFSGNNQPCMSGDQRDRLSAMQRRVCEDAATSVLEVLAALPQGEYVGGKLVEQLRHAAFTEPEPNRSTLHSKAADLIKSQAAQIASLSARVAEVEREQIIAPAECSKDCDDPDCPYSHTPLTLRQAYENAMSRMSAAKARASELEPVNERLEVAEVERENGRLKAQLVEAALAKIGGDHDK